MLAADNGGFGWFVSCYRRVCRIYKFFNKNLVMIKSNKLDKYEKQGKLGEGTYGVVYQARGMGYWVSGMLCR